MNRYDERPDPMRDDDPVRSDTASFAAHTVCVNNASSLRHCIDEYIAHEASRLLEHAVASELDAFLFGFGTKVTGRAPHLVRNGRHPARQIVTNVGPVTIRMPKLRARDGMRAKFRSRIVPAYRRRALSPLNDARAALLHALCRGSLAHALFAIQLSNEYWLPPGAMRTLTERWRNERRRWSRGPLTKAEPRILWLDCIDYPGVESCNGPAQLFVAGDIGGSWRMLGVAAAGTDAIESWTRLLLDLRSRGLRPASRWAHGIGMHNGIHEAVAAIYPELLERSECAPKM